MPGRETYRVGVIGCGRIGSEWDPIPPIPLTHAGAFATLERTRLVAGTNRGRERLEAFGHKWGVTALYHDYRDMLAREALDIVCVATHPEVHEEQVAAAARAGVRGIFCEKPMALSLAEADAMIEACDRAGTVLMVNHTRRWSPVYHKARELIQEGAIGQLLTMVGHCQGVKPHPGWRADEEGPLLHDATHTFDAFRFFAGGAEWVVGTAGRRLHPYRVEDESLSILHFQSGVTAVTVVNELTEYARFDLELLGTHGKIALGTSGNGLWTSVPSPRAARESDPNLDWHDLVPGPFPETAEASPILEAAREMVACLDGAQAPTSSGRDGRAALEMVMAIYESQRQGNARISLPLPAGPSTLRLMREQGMF